MHTLETVGSSAQNCYVKSLTLIQLKSFLFFILNVKRITNVYANVKF